jgi:hypothetical protein
VPVSPANAAGDAAAATLAVVHGNRAYLSR